jgi:UDP-N-acetylmuramoyl-tripeptide--D-alanyl-D-alanine ligase
MLLHHLSLADVAAAVHGRWIIAPARAGDALPPISTDTRTLVPGDLFLALRGENFDGHNYLEQALEAGAGGLIVAESAALPADIARRFGDVFVLGVRDALEALGDLAHAVRRLARGTEIVGIVGSAGKTTVKEMLAAILRAHVGPERVLATEANLNNLIGVPKMLLKLEPHHEFAVLEAGMNQPGELARLSVIADADVTLVTNIGSAHRGNFASAEEHVRAKLDWPLHASPRRRIFLNVDGGQLDRLREASTHLDVTLYGIDHDESAVWARAIEPIEPYGYRFEVVVEEDHRIPVTLRLFGAQNISNAIAATAVAWSLGVAAETITAALGELRPARWRGELVEIAGRRLVLDHYNATPEAVVQSIHSLGDIECVGRRIAVLGTMLELGDTAPRAHRRVGRAAVAAGIDALATIGDDMLYAHEAIRGQQRASIEARHAETIEELAAIVANTTRPGDLVLLKGSRGMKMERILPLLEDSLAATAIPA